MAKRIAFTGGSGKAGRHVLPWLINKGYDVLNLDIVPLDRPGIANLNVDITDSGQVFNALTSHSNFDDLDVQGGPKPFVAMPRIFLKPDDETFRINTIGTYNVIEAPRKNDARTARNRFCQIKTTQCLQASPSHRLLRGEGGPTGRTRGSTTAWAKGDTVNLHYFGYIR